MRSFLITQRESAIGEVVMREHISAANVADAIARAIESAHPSATYIQIEEGEEYRAELLRLYPSRKWDVVDSFDPAAL